MTAARPESETKATKAFGEWVISSARVGCQLMEKSLSVRVPACHVSCGKFRFISGAHLALETLNATSPTRLHSQADGGIEKKHVWVIHQFDDTSIG